MSDEANEPETPNLMEVDLDKIPSAVLRRLIEEVRNGDDDDRQKYSRWHNRHNRSR